MIVELKPASTHETRSDSCAYTSSCVSFTFHTQSSRNSRLRTHTVRCWPNRPTTRMADELSAEPTAGRSRAKMRKLSWLRPSASPAAVVMESVVLATAPTVEEAFRGRPSERLGPLCLSLEHTPAERNIRI